MAKVIGCNEFFHFKNSLGYNKVAWTLIVMIVHMIISDRALIYIHNVPPRYRLSKFSAQIICFQSSYIQDLRTWSTRTRCGMRNASPALSASSQSAHRVSWPRVRTSTVLPATKRSLPRNASTASRYKHRLYHSLHLVIIPLCLTSQSKYLPFQAHHLWRDQLPGPAMALRVFRVQNLP